MGQTETKFCDDHIPLFSCYCKKNIPLFFLKPNNGKMEIIMKDSFQKADDIKVNLDKFIQELCTVATKRKSCHKHTDNTIFNYCFNCKKWLCKTCYDIYSKQYQQNTNIQEPHITTIPRINIHPFSNLRSLPYSLYCNQCYVNINLADLYNYHPNHDIIPILMTKNNISLNDLNNILSFNSRITQEFIVKLNKKQILLNPQQEKQKQELTQMNETIQSAYSANNLINEKLIFLYKCIEKTTLMCEVFRNKSKMRLHQVLMLNKPQLKTDFSTIEEEAAYLIEYFKTNFLFKTRDYNRCIAEIDCYTKTISNLIKLNETELAFRDDHQIIIWNVKDNKSWSIRLPKDIIRCLALLYDGRLASGSSDGTIKLWNTTTRKCIVILAPPNSSLNVYCLAVLKDGNLASGHSNYLIKLWDTIKKECTATLMGGKDIVRTLLGLTDGRLVVGARMKTIRIWDLNTNVCSGELKGHFDYIECLIQLKNGLLASGSNDSRTLLWNLTTNQCITSLYCGHPVLALIELNDERLAIGTRGFLSLWSLKRYHALMSIDCVYGLNFVQLKNGRLFSGGSILKLKEWDVQYND